MTSTLYVFHNWIEATETSDTVISVFGQWWDGNAAPSGDGGHWYRRQAPQIATAGVIG